jgi:hypothetical protein
LALIIIAILAAGIVVLNPFAAKVDTAISITSSQELTEGDSLSISLTDINSRPVSGALIQINITDLNGSTTQKTLTTDASGNGVIALGDLTSGQYMINVSYDGNSSFKSSFASQNININPKVVQSVSTESAAQSSIHPGFTPSYKEGPLTYGYKGDRWGFVTPTGNFFEM